MGELGEDWFRVEPLLPPCVHSQVPTLACCRPALRRHAVSGHPDGRDERGRGTQCSQRLHVRAPDDGRHVWQVRLLPLHPSPPVAG